MDARKNRKFPKSERLCAQPRIQQLFEKGERKLIYPVLFYAFPSADPVHQVLISAPKKRYKRAVDRNYLKRMMREAYRLQKSEIEDVSPRFDLGFQYVGKEIEPYTKIAASVHQFFTLLRKGNETSELKG